MTIVNDALGAGRLSEMRMPDGWVVEPPRGAPIFAGSKPEPDSRGWAMFAAAGWFLGDSTPDPGRGEGPARHRDRGPRGRRSEHGRAAGLGRPALARRAARRRTRRRGRRGRRAGGGLARDAGPGGWRPRSTCPAGAIRGFRRRRGGGRARGVVQDGRQRARGGGGGARAGRGRLPASMRHVVVESEVEDVSGSSASGSGRSHLGPRRDAKPAGGPAPDGASPRREPPPEHVGPRRRDRARLLLHHPPGPAPAAVERPAGAGAKADDRRPASPRRGDRRGV